MDCPLCNFEKLKESGVYYEDEKVLIVNDVKLYQFKRRILAVLKRHTKIPTAEERAYVYEKLKSVAEKEFRGHHWIFQETLQSVPNHWHIHASME